MAIKKCPFCGNEKDDGREYRLAIYIGDQRLAVIPPGQASMTEVIAIVKGTPGAYLMQEALQDGRLFSAQFVSESLYRLETDGSISRR